jgi:hypothetical protein
VGLRRDSLLYISECVPPVGAVIRRAGREADTLVAEDSPPAVSAPPSSCLRPRAVRSAPAPPDVTLLPLAPRSHIVHTPLGPIAELKWDPQLDDHASASFLYPWVSPSAFFAHCSRSSSRFVGSHPRGLPSPSPWRTTCCETTGLARRWVSLLCTLLRVQRGCHTLRWRHDWGLR